MQEDGSRREGDEGRSKSGPGQSLESEDGRRERERDMFGVISQL